MSEEIYCEWPTDTEYEDSLEHEWEWEGVLNDVEILMEKFKTDNWLVQVEGFGWRKASGSLYVKAKTASELIIKTLPNTENHFKIYDRGDHFAINNSHHDSPTGSEWYYVRPLEEV